jgi:hypothetical protein
MYVKQDGRVFPCCQSYSLDGAPVGDLREQPLEEIFNSQEMRRLRRAHAEGSAAEIDMCARCTTPIPHPLLVAASVVERWIYSRKLPRALLAPIRGELVQIERSEAAPRKSAL